MKIENGLRNGKFYGFRVYEVEEYTADPARITDAKAYAYNYKLNKEDGKMETSAKRTVPHGEGDIFTSWAEAAVDLKKKIIELFKKDVLERLSHGYNICSWVWGSDGYYFESVEVIFDPIHRRYRRSCAQSAYTGDAQEAYAPIYGDLSVIGLSRVNAIQKVEEEEGVEH